MRLCFLTNWDNPSDIPQGAQKTDVSVMSEGQQGWLSRARDILGHL